MSKWDMFRCSEDGVPATWFEASVFLNNAMCHLRNRIDGPLGETWHIIEDARTSVHKGRHEVSA